MPSIMSTYLKSLDNIFKTDGPASWILGCTLAACIFVFDWHFKPFAEIKNVKRPSINKSLMFGAQEYTCDKHSKGDITCEDIHCRHGPLSYMLETISNAKVSLDLCIYTLNAQLFTDAFIDAHNRGVRVRVIADCDKAFHTNSGIMQFKEREMNYRVRMSPFIMHHKFVIVDDEILINGSLNFNLRSALGNWEHVIVTSDPLLVKPFVIQFQTLWDDFAPGNVAPSFGYSQFDRYS